MKYHVFKDGRILSNGARELKLSIGSHGYYVFNWSKEGKVKQYLVHRVIATAFIPNPDKKPYVNHIDGNKLNNRMENLEWCTHGENMRHARTNGLTTKGQAWNSTRRKVSDETVRAIRKERQEDRATVMQLSRKHGVASGSVSRIIANKSYKDVI